MELVGAWTRTDRARATNGVHFQFFENDCAAQTHLTTWHCLRACKQPGVFLVQLTSLPSLSLFSPSLFLSWNSKAKYTYCIVDIQPDMIKRSSDPKTIVQKKIKIKEEAKKLEDA